MTTVEVSAAGSKPATAKVFHVRWGSGSPVARPVINEKQGGDYIVKSFTTEAAARNFLNQKLTEVGDLEGRYNASFHDQVADAHRAVSLPFPVLVRLKLESGIKVVGLAWKATPTPIGRTSKARLQVMEPSEVRT